jgi:AraC family transcriptional regulator
VNRPWQRVLSALSAKPFDDLDIERLHQHGLAATPSEMTHAARCSRGAQLAGQDSRHRADLAHRRARQPWPPSSDLRRDIPKYVGHVPIRLPSKPQYDRRVSGGQLKIKQHNRRAGQRRSYEVKPMLISPVASRSPPKAPFALLSSTFHCPSSFSTSRAFKPLQAASILDQIDSEQAHETKAIVDISPFNAVTRRTAASGGMTAEIIQATGQIKTEFRFRAPIHLLVVCEEATRDQGDSFVEGLPRSTLRTLSRKITFVPAGHEYFEWHQPRKLARLIYFYLEPSKLADAGVADIAFTPRLFFEHAPLWDSAMKLKRSIERTSRENRLYFEAIGMVLMHELVHLERGAKAKDEGYVRGGLAMRHQRLVAAYIEEHLPDQISVSTLASLADLSPFHFCRAFKTSFGIPPHRYHTGRRIEHAKALLTKRDLSITQIGLTMGFSETSSFCTAFRKATGVTPSGYRTGVN